MNFLDPRLPDSFWNKCIPEPNSGCWLWHASSSRGYGKLKYKGKFAAAHRVTYLAVHGTISRDLELDHLCRVRCCVNPKHLEAVKHKTNVRRGSAGDAQAARTHCPSGHAYDELNTRVLVRRGGGSTYRTCQTCARKSWREYKRRIRAKK